MRGAPAVQRGAGNHGDWPAGGPAPQLPLQTRRKEAWRGPTIWEGLLPQALWPAPSEPDHISLPPQALRSLKAKQRTEKRIEALHAKLDTVQGILDRIYASQTDQMVFNAYQAGVGALRLSMKDVTVEKAESLVDQIQEVREGPWRDTSRRRRGALRDLSFLFSQTRLFTR